MILIVGSGIDPHVLSVLKTLDGLGRPYSLVDTFSQASQGVHHQVLKNVAVDLRGCKNLLTGFHAVWWRQKPKFTIPIETPTALYDYHFVHREWNYLINYLASETAHLFSINDRDKASAADNKISQLKAASDCGFQIPSTLISNDFDSILLFVEGTTGKVVFKTLTPYMPPTGLLTFTTEVDAAILREQRQRLAVAPGIFQEFVEKQFELRITVVGADVFAARIDSKHSDRSLVDWRRDVFADIYDVYELDERFRERLLLLHKKLGLFYGAYDFIVDESSNPIFLEVNPSGQWMWLEDKLGFPIGERIALALANASPA